MKLLIKHLQGEKNLKENEKNITDFYFHKYSGEVTEYLKIVENYIEYYHFRARKCKYKYYSFNIIKYIALALIPVVQSFGGIQKFPWIATIVSSICLLTEAILELLRTKEKWILYRNTDNALLKEQREFVTGKGKYIHEEDKYAIFVKMVESLIDDEARKWSEMVRSEKKDSENR